MISSTQERELIQAAEIKLAQVNIIMEEIDKAMLDNKRRREKIEELMNQLNPTGKCLHCQSVVVSSRVLTCDICLMEKEAIKKLNRDVERF